jgi:transposase InsO family protein
MGMPELVITAVLVEGRSKSAVAREYGISRRWVITLVQRFLAEGRPGLAPRSRGPRTSPPRTPITVEDQIVAIRKELDRDGHDAGAATIAHHLRVRHGRSPATSTIWLILTARGFVTPQSHKRPKSSYLRFAAEQPNERRQSDITHWHVADGTGVEILNLIEDHSRLALTSRAHRVFKAEHVDAIFRDCATRYGNPACLLTDNGAVFTGAPRRGGRVALEVTLHTRGIHPAHSRPYHPQTCGKVERFHQSLKKHLATRPPAATLPGLQAQLNAFLAYYNNTRPHRALHRATPTQAYAARPKAVPTGTPLHSEHWRIRHDRLDVNGVFTLRHNSRLHHIRIGQRHAGTKILVLVHDRHIRVLDTTDD